MNRDTARTLTVALLAVVATGLAASAFTGAIESGPLEEFGLGSDPATQSPGQSSGDGGLIGGDATRSSFGLPLLCITNPVFVYGVPLLLAAGAVFLFERFDTWIASRMSVGFGLFLGIPYALLVACPGNETRFQAVTEYGAVFSRAGTDIATPFLSNPLLVLAGLVLGLVGVGVLVHRLRSRDPGDGTGRPFHVPLVPRPANPNTDLAGVAEVAGRAADRLDDAADVDNEVYRAWREMTTYLDVDRPAASTPREFEAAAVEAGLAPGDVAALTSVFEAVRYGDVDPEPHADEAVAALRRIESAAVDAAEN